MIIKEKIDCEIKKLQQLGFLNDEDSTQSVKTSLHSQPEWADSFWRRRLRHQSRPDPEIPFIEKLSPNNVLEIGCAYGRVTRKIYALNDKRTKEKNPMKVTGIDIQPDFERFTKKYIKEFPELSRVRFLYGNFLEAEKFFSEDEFDVVVIPMNTVPGFPFDLLDPLFQSINYVLSDSGHCIFSTRKMSYKIEDIPASWLNESYEGEFLLDLKKTPISLIFYSFPAKKTSYGFSRIKYHIYHFFDRNMCSNRKLIVRMTNDIVFPGVLDEIISRNGFKIDYIDNNSFTRIYSISKDIQ